MAAIILNDLALDEIEAAARAASPGLWMLGETPTETVEQAVEHVAGHIRHGQGPRLWVVCLGPLAEGEPYRTPAITGNGPTSEANARFLVEAQPRVVLALIAEIRRLRQQVTP